MSRRLCFLRCHPYRPTSESSPVLSRMSDPGSGVVIGGVVAVVTVAKVAEAPDWASSMENTNVEGKEGQVDDKSIVTI